MFAIVSHDAGGAEILASYVARNNFACRFVLKGPALAVFRRRLGDIETCSLETALAACDTVLTGTSWQSDLELRAIALAHTLHRRCVSFLDHWGHYIERFERDGHLTLPDEIWVGDELALVKAQQCFPKTPISLVANPYFADIADKLEALPRPRDKSGQRLLYVCEPLSEHGLLQFGDERHWGYTEFDSLAYLMENLDRIDANIQTIVVRPHPSEAPGKYDDTIRSMGTMVTLGGAVPLLEEIAQADIVAGCESMAMVIGLLAGRRVISAIPPGGKPCALPHAVIEPLQHLVERI
ncbi:hypothetical protein [Devosia alba]|uniref:hypothetical protein n=1 Tax=Devosia alba TaxID=3152360 RepID=UPI003262EE13